MVLFAGPGRADTLNPADCKMLVSSAWRQGSPLEARALLERDAARCSATMQLLLRTWTCLLQEDVQCAERHLIAHANQFSKAEAERDFEEQQELRDRLRAELDKHREQRREQAQNLIDQAAQYASREPAKALGLLADAEKLLPTPSGQLLRLAIHLDQQQLADASNALGRFRIDFYGRSSPAEQVRYAELEKRVQEFAQKATEEVREVITQARQLDKQSDPALVQVALDRLASVLRWHWMEREILFARARIFEVIERPTDGLQEMRRTYRVALTNWPEVVQRLEQQVAILRVFVPDDVSARVTLARKEIPLGEQQALNPGTLELVIVGRNTPLLKLQVELASGQRKDITVHLRAFSEHMRVAESLWVRERWLEVIGEYERAMTDTLPSQDRATVMMPDVVARQLEAHERGQMARQGLEIINSYPKLKNLALFRQKLAEQLVELQMSSAEGTDLIIDAQPAAPVRTTTGLSWSLLVNPGAHELTATKGTLTIKGRCNFHAGQRLVMQPLRFPKTKESSPLAKIKDNKLLLGPGRYASLVLGASAAIAGITLLALDGRQDCPYGQCARALDVRDLGIGLTTGGLAFLGLSIFGFSANAYLHRSDKNIVGSIDCS
jgi:hypothetical protein